MTADTTELVPLTPSEAAELANCERIVEEHKAKFIEVGLALFRIRTHRLYKATHTTFTAYLQERWNLTRQRAHQFENASAVANMLRDTPTESGDVRVVVPESERQAREIAGMEPSEATATWDEAVEEAGGKQPTAKQLREVAERKTNSNVLHSSKSVEWWTPEPILDAVRRVVGGKIDLDPASSAEANARVQAADFMDEEQDGLTQSWQGRVWCNPPYGSDANGSRQSAWLEKAIAEVETGNAELVAFLCNAHIGTQWFRRVWNYPLCLLHERVRFVRPDGEPGNAPTHGSALVLIVQNYGEWEAPFVAAVSSLGVVALPTDLSDIVHAWDRT